MVDKLFTLTLGGKERTLLYGTMGYYTYIKELTGQEPFDWLQSFDKMREESVTGKISVLIEDLVVIVYAGLNSYLDSKDQDNVPFDKVKKWCNGMTGETASKVFSAAFGTVQDDTPGEPQPQAVTNGTA